MAIGKHCHHHAGPHPKTYSNPRSYPNLTQKKYQKQHKKIPYPLSKDWGGGDVKGSPSSIREKTAADIHICNY